ncbi:MAG: Tic22 family protein [Cyanobacteriota bacterium]|nr:Tic22 family protein [Cyanobacteriota bacterium]
MKSFIQWGATLSLLGSTLWGSLLGVSMPAWALDEQDIVEKLQAVPVFAITDAEGSPLIASIPQSEDSQDTVPVSGVFINRSDAEAFVERLRSQDPDIANQIRVTTISMAEVYQLDRENEDAPEGLQFAYVPNRTQVDEAIGLLANQGETLEQFPGVPLFIGIAGPDSGYLTIEQGGEQLIPMFFNRTELESVLEQFKTQQPELAETVGIQVESLEGVIRMMETSDNPQLEQLVLVPPIETLEFLRTLPEGQ